jgi:repressor LexA
MSFGKIINELRIKQNMTQDELAHAVGYKSRSTIAKIESGERDVSQTMVVKLAKALNTSTSVLMGSDDNIDSVPAAEPSLTTQPEYRGFAVLDHDNIYMIPIYRTVSAGYGAFADEYIIGYEPVYLSSKKEAEETFAVVVKGDSMLPRIDEDDIAIVHKQDFFENGDIVVAIQCGNGDGFIKRAFLRKDKLSLESFNPNYPVMTFTGPDIESIKIIGVVKKIIKSI